MENSNPLDSTSFWLANLSYRGSDCINDSASVVNLFDPNDI